MRDINTLREILQAGQVIPAHPLALNAERKLDERHQRGLTRYYLAAGSGGLAVGVHTTQFDIHKPQVGLYAPVLELAMEVVRDTFSTEADFPVMVAGLVGDTNQASSEAKTAVDIGYDCGLMSMSAFGDSSIDEMIEHASLVSEIIPLFGFYLQPAVGGRILPKEFWRRFVEIDNVIGIKIAPFNRYQTLDVVQAVADSGRAHEIALYTGNDDNIIIDLLTRFPFKEMRISGGLLGQWAVWTKKAVEMLEEIKRLKTKGEPVPVSMLQLNAELTDANKAIFDPQNQFSGCISGIHEILRRQGLLAGNWCLNSDEQLSPGQLEEIDRISKAYPHLNDDEFVGAHLEEWLT